MTKVLQASLTDAQVDAINNRTDPALYNAWAALLFIEDAAQFESKVVPALDLGLYAVGWDIPHSNLERVFEVGNYMVGNSKNFRTHDRATSVSVGNVAVTDEGKVFVCQSFGWGELTGPLADRFRDLAKESQL